MIHQRVGRRQTDIILNQKETSMNERAIKSLMSTVSSLQVFDGQTHCGYLIVCLVKHCKYDLSKYVDNATWCSLKLFSFLPGGEYFKRKVSVL